ncbi:MAG: universal stress protein [Planctomycetota bacterium]|nr:universal stress protein [Planctomycetota bacterium]
MASLKKILVATDFSSGAEQAAEVAIAWAERLGAELHWVHGVEHLPASTPPSAAPLIASYVERARQQGRDSLAAAVERARARGLSSEMHMVDAPAAGGVVGLAKELAADCVIVGSRGHSALQQLVLGSVAERIVRDAPCRVLVVRGKHHPAEPGTIVFGDDLSELSLAARGDAFDLAHVLGARLDVVHAPDLGIPYFSSMALALPSRLFDELRTESAEQIDAFAADAPGDVEISKVIAHDKPAHAICERVKQVDAGLAIVGTRSLTDLERVLLGSVADRVVRHATCSVLVVR